MTLGKSLPALVSSSAKRGHSSHAVCRLHKGEQPRGPAEAEIHLLSTWQAGEVAGSPPPQWGTGFSFTHRCCMAGRVGVGLGKRCQWLSTSVASKRPKNVSAPMTVTMTTHPPRNVPQLLNVPLQHCVHSR